MDMRLLDGKVFAVLMLDESAGGEDRWAFFAGTAQWDGKCLLVDCGPDKKPFNVPENTFDRIRPVDDILGRLLDHAEYYVPLRIARMSDKEDCSGYINTGLKYPWAEASNL